MPDERGDSSEDVVGAFIWGLVSGLLLGPFLVGILFAGYRVGYTGRGRPSLVASAVALLVGSATTTVLIVNGAAKSGCPSCMDSLIFAPIGLLFLLIPLAIGYWFGHRSYRRWLDQYERSQPAAPPQ